VSPIQINYLARESTKFWTTKRGLNGLESLVEVDSSDLNDE